MDFLKTTENQTQQERSENLWKNSTLRKFSNESEIITKNLIENWKNSFNWCEKWMFHKNIIRRFVFKVNLKLKIELKSDKKWSDNY